MSIFQKLKNLDVAPDAIVKLEYSDGVDVFVHNETELDTALSETDVVSMFSELIATPGLKAQSTYGGNILESIRDNDLLDDYPRDDSFSEYLQEQINDNFHDVDLIDCSIEKYDHKRGYCTLTANVSVQYDNLMDTVPSLYGWTAQVTTENGTLMLS